MNKEFERYVANHCAPVLYRRKPAALLPRKLFVTDDGVNQLEGMGISVGVLSRGENNSLLILYHPHLLEKALSHHKAVEVLSGLGYPVRAGVEQMLGFLAKRFAYAEEFPHEVGFFLGYPPSDVVGFMTCKTDCKICGLWKVYGDVEKAVALFEEYARCRQALLSHVEKGGSLFKNDLPALAG